MFPRPFRGGRLSYAASVRDRLTQQYVDVEAHNTRNKKSDNAKAKRDLDHQCTVNLDEGIPLTIAWQKEVYGIG